MSEMKETKKRWQDRNRLFDVKLRHRENPFQCYRVMLCTCIMFLTFPAFAGEPGVWHSIWNIICIAFSIVICGGVLVAMTVGTGIFLSRKEEDTNGDEDVLGLYLIGVVALLILLNIVLSSITWYWRWILCIMICYSIILPVTLRRRKRRIACKVNKIESSRRLVRRAQELRLTSDRRIKFRALIRQRVNTLQEIFDIDIFDDDIVIEDVGAWDEEGHLLPCHGKELIEEIADYEEFGGKLVPPSCKIRTDVYVDCEEYKLFLWFTEDRILRARITNSEATATDFSCRSWDDCVIEMRQLIGEESDVVIKNEYLHNALLWKTDIKKRCSTDSVHVEECDSAFLVEPDGDIIEELPCGTSRLRDYFPDNSNLYDCAIAFISHDSITKPWSVSGKFPIMDQEVGLPVYIEDVNGRITFAVSNPKAFYNCNKIKKVCYNVKSLLVKFEEEIRIRLPRAVNSAMKNGHSINLVNIERERDLISNELSMELCDFCDNIGIEITSLEVTNLSLLDDASLQVLKDARRERAKEMAKVETEEMIRDKVGEGRYLEKIEEATILNMSKVRGNGQALSGIANGFADRVKNNRNNRKHEG